MKTKRCSLGGKDGYLSDSQDSEALVVDERGKRYPQFILRVRLGMQEQGIEHCVHRKELTTKELPLFDIVTR